MAKHKAKTIGEIAKFKKAETKKTAETSKNEIPSSEEIAKVENEKAAKAEAETAAAVTNEAEQKTAPEPATPPSKEESPKPKEVKEEKKTEETKEEKKAKQKAEYEAKKAAKKAAKEAKKSEKETPKETPKEAPKEAKKEQPVDKNSEIEEAIVVEETKDPEPKPSETKPEVVDTKKNAVTKTRTKNVSATIAAMVKGDRLSADRQVDFLGLLKSEYLDKATEIPAEHLAAYQKIFNEGMAMNCLYLHEQIMREGREILGVKLDDKVMPVLTTLLNDCWGIDVKSLPTSPDGQLRIQFDMPEDTKQSVKDDIAAVETVVETSEKKTFPDADENLSDEQKLDTIRAILSLPGTPEAKKEGKDQMALNIYNAIEWARKAYSMKDNTPAQITAFMFEKLYKNATSTPLALAGMRSRVFSTLNRYNTMVVPHIIIGNLFKFSGYDDQTISDLCKVLLASHLNWIAGKNIAIGKPKDTKFTQEEIENYLIEQGYEQLSVVSDADVDALLKGVTLHRKFKYLTDADLNGKLCLDTIAKLKGNSENIAKDLIKNAAKFYTTKVERIAKYADFSDYKK